MVKWLLDHGANPNTECDSCETPLGFAVVDGPLSVIKLLFENGSDATRGEVLHRLIDRKLPDRIAVANLLVDQGAPVNNIMFQGREERYHQMTFMSIGTPLHRAAGEGFLDFAEVLVQRGADPPQGDPESGEGRTSSDC